nr:hypothetical protein [Microbacterium sp. MF43]
MSRIWRLALVGAATAFAWIVLALLLGFGSGEARADDSSGDKGLLGAVSSAVDGTASTLTKTVTATTSTVSEVVNTVVAVAPAPVQQPVREVVTTVSTVVTTTKPVTEVVSSGVVSTVTKPVVEVVTAVPMVGEIVSGVGLDEVVTDVSQTVDDTLGGVAKAVTDVASTVGRPPAGTTPPLPEVPATPAIPTPPVLPEGPAPRSVDDQPAVFASRVAATAAGASVHSLPTAYELGSAVAAAVAATATPLGTAGSPASAGGLCPPTASSSGPGGAGSGAWALVAIGPLAALRAWVRRAGLEDEDAPPAPAGSTDVSPD